MTPCRTDHCTLASAIALVAVLVAMVFTPPPAHAAASGSSGGVRGVKERQLRAFETRVLGQEHAAEHARSRRAVRRPATRRLLARSARRARLLARRPRARKADASLGAWTSVPFSIPVMGIHAAMLPTGKVLWFAYPSNPSRGAKIDEAQAYLWDPRTGATKRVDPPINPDTGRPVNIWCGAQSLLADGRLLVTGGNLKYQETGYAYRGLDRVYTFNPYNETWTEQPRMRHGRWYPTQNLLPDGRTLIMSGLDENGQPRGGPDTPLNKDVEVFTPSPDLDGRGTVTLAQGPGHALEGMYPHMFVMPSGRTLIAGPYRADSFYMSLSGGSYASDGAPDPIRERYWGSAVLVPGGPSGSGTIMQVGGSPRGSSSGASATTETFTEGQGAWQAAPSMRTGRAHHNTVLLPDGSMVTIGGGYGSVEGDNWVAGEDHKAVEIWDPATREWRVGPSQAENRGYHSTALLLPDGRVVSAGDDVNGGINRDTAEIYSPPYLFKGARPLITGAPGTVDWGQSFNVATSGDVSRAVLVAPAAVTHSVDMNQRVLELALEQRSGGVALTAPGRAAIAPPGRYMLFVLNAQGVPSVAKWVQLGSKFGSLTGASDPEPQLAPAGQPAGVEPVGSAGTPGAPPARAREGAGRVRALGRFESRRISPWRRKSGTVATVRGGHSGRYGLRLRGNRRTGALAVRTLSRLPAGSYRLSLWMRGRSLSVVAGRARPTLLRSSTPRRWRRRTVAMRLTGAPVELGMSTGRARAVVVDDVMLTSR
jgi:Domain of unknown function (DUF1929)